MSSESDEPKRAFQLEREDGPDHETFLRLKGKLGFDEAAEIWDALHDGPVHTSGDKVHVDLSGVSEMDGGATALVVQLERDLRRVGATVSFEGARDNVKGVLAFYQGSARKRRASAKKEKPLSVFEQIGKATVDVLVELKLVLDFTGRMVVSTIDVVRRPTTANWRDIPALMNRAGTDAVPIILLINFLIGLVMAFQAAVQLKKFGANIFVADLVGLSIARELGPLMTAIIVCGRTGASFAAELGTMTVSEEVDALRTLGIGPLRFLVFPRIVALFLVLPVLTLIADAIAMLGGLCVGLGSLDISPRAYINETVETMRMWDVFQGIIKCGIFGIAIGLIACQQGLATSGGAEGVGRRTTSAVVITLFALILIDAGFTVMFHALNV
jgi:phospholipid/cholesterol/gamma-HCH transport system permease protein